MLSLKIAVLHHELEYYFILMGLWEDFETNIKAKKLTAVAFLGCFASEK